MLLPGATYGTYPPGPNRETLLMHAYRRFRVLGLFAAMVKSWQYNRRANWNGGSA